MFFQCVQFAPGIYDNSELVLTELEKEVLEIRAKDKEEKTVGDTAEVIQTPSVRVTLPVYSVIR